MLKLHPQFYFIFTFLVLIYTPVQAKNMHIPCEIAERSCLIKELTNSIIDIEDERWRDKSYRELAKSLAYNNQIDEAIKIIDKINNPDTKALTIRGIGMKYTELKLSIDEYKRIFKILRIKADEIEHEASHQIALTYIGMAQSYANMDNDAIKTAQSMKNKSLRHKALGEIAEIQAENSKNVQAITTIGLIESISYKNKAYRIISKIMAKNKDYNNAFNATKKITNPMTKSDSLQIIIGLMETEEKKKSLK